jgi:hypothetical protein
VWKRMGLGVDDQGKAQRRARGDEGKIQGFSPTRRALMHVIGDNLIRQNYTPDRQDGDYRLVYRQYKDDQLAKYPEVMANVVNKTTGKTEVKNISKARAHKRSLRYMEKRLLRNIWREWQARAELSPSGSVPAN